MSWSKPDSLSPRLWLPNLRSWLIVKGNASTLGKQLICWGATWLCPNYSVRRWPLRRKSRLLDMFSRFMRKPNIEITPIDSYLKSEHGLSNDTNTIISSHFESQTYNNLGKLSNHFRIMKLCCEFFFAQQSPAVKLFAHISRRRMRNKYRNRWLYSAPID